MRVLGSALLDSALNTTPLLALLPLVVIGDLVVVAYCIVDLYKPERRVYGGDKTAWLLIILAIGMLVLASTLLGIILLGAPNTTPLVALAPLVGVVLYLPVVAYFIVDLYKPERRVYGGDKTFWLVAILFIGIIGIMAYLLFGREN